MQAPNAQLWRGSPLCVLGRPLQVMKLLPVGHLHWDDRAYGLGVGVHLEKTLVLKTSMLY